MKRVPLFALIAVSALLALHLSNVGGQPPEPVVSEIHCKHFIFGYPLGAPASNDLIIRDLYALSSNDRTKFADLVCYYLTPHETMGDLDLFRLWRNDPWLAEDETLEARPVARDDYKDAHEMPAETRYDRGHQAPLASFKGSRFASQVNYYSNITPQRSDLNQAPWKRLEDKVRELVSEYGEVWVMTRPLYEEEMPPLPHCDEEHTVPSGYWKIVVVSGAGATQVAAFIMEQDTDRYAEVQDHLVTVADVEERSGLSFFWELPTAEQDALKSVTSESWVEEWFD